MRTKTPELDQRILDVAAHLFAGNHFHSVRMEDISAEAEVGKGTLYRYFRDKEELYLALLHRAAEQIQERIHEVTAREGDTVAQLEALIATSLEFFDEQPHIFELIQQAEASRGTNHPWQAARDGILREVMNLFEKGKREGAFVVREPLTSALIMLGGVRALIRFGAKPRSAHLAKQIVQTVLHGAAIDGGR